MAQVYLTSPLAITYMSLTGILIPLRLIDMGTEPAMIGIFVGSAGILGATMAVPAGAMAESIGPKRALLIGGFLNTLAGASFALIDNYWILLMIQILRGAPHSLGWVAGQTYIMGIGSPDQRATIAGRFGSVNSMLGFFSPIIMGVIAQFVGTQQAFWFVAAYSLFFTTLGLSLPELRTKSAAGGSSSQQSFGGFSSALELLRLRPVRVALLLTFVRLYISSGWMPFYIVFLRTQGFPPALIGTVSGMTALIASATGLQTGWIARRMSKEIATAIGLAMGGLAVAISPFTAVIPFVYLPSLLAGVSTGLSLPLVMAILADVAPAGKRGIAMGLRTTGNQSANLVSPIAMGLIVGPAGMMLGFFAHAMIIWGMVGVSVFLHLRDVAESRIRALQDLAPADTRT